MIDTRYLVSAILGALHRRKFEAVRTFSLFLGYSRSGHSLIGSLLDAHKNIVVSHELNVLDLVLKGYSLDQINYLILRNSRVHAAKGRRWSGYSYVVKGQWQGSFEEVHVLGDKKGGASSTLLHQHPDLLSRLAQLSPVPVNLIHVIRNPFDIIATRYRRFQDRKRQHGATICEITENLYTQVQVMGRIKTQAAFPCHDVYYEDLFKDPAAVIEGLLDHLGVEVYAGYVEACTDILYETPHRSRLEIPWTDQELDRVNWIISAIPFLSHYTF